MQNPPTALKCTQCGVPLPSVFGDTDECAENVDVTLTAKGSRETKKTNNYGDFEFEGLNADKEFTVKIKHPGYASRDFTIQTKADVYLGEIVLTR
jgi:hypothetical protein